MLCKRKLHHADCRLSQKDRLFCQGQYAFFVQIHRSGHRKSGEQLVKRKEKIKDKIHKRTKITAMEK